MLVADRSVPVALLPGSFGTSTMLSVTVVRLVVGTYIWYTQVPGLHKSTKILQQVLRKTSRVTDGNRDKTCFLLLCSMKSKDLQNFTYPGNVLTKLKKQVKK